ncbi:MAG: hypothetical protein AB7I18_02370 [Candidatus Berkiella sp.]
MRELVLTESQQVSGGDSDHQCDEHDHEHEHEREHEHDNKNRTFDFSDWF